MDEVDGTDLSSRVSLHPKLTMPETPPMNYGEIEWMPRIRVNEWLDHSSKMILFEWCPLTYFVLAAVVAPKD